jgi:hypothetical protein
LWKAEKNSRSFEILEAGCRGEINDGKMNVTKFEWVEKEIDNFFVEVI